MNFHYPEMKIEGEGKVRQRLCGEFSRGHVYMPVCMSRGCVGNLMIDLLFIPCFCYLKKALNTVEF